MIKILILEDEIPAKNKLKRFLTELEADIEIVAEIDTIASGITFLKNNIVDLIISDIELLDGNSFEIYENVSISCPIIFVTAYNEFWMNAFESNGIDYLLKPFTKERFIKAWDKYLMLKQANNENDQVLNSLKNIIAQNSSVNKFKKRFEIRNRQSIYFLDTENICFFEANEGLVFAHDNLGNKHLLLEATLKEIEDKLNPLDFYKINRCELVGKAFIEKMEYCTKNTLTISFKGYKKQLVTSQTKTAGFRHWMKL